MSDQAALEPVDIADVFILVDNSIDMLLTNERVAQRAAAAVLVEEGPERVAGVRVAGRQALSHGDELLVGRTRLLVDLTPSGGGTA